MAQAASIRQAFRRNGAGKRARSSLFTRTFLTVAVAELAYFTADGVLLPALPRYVEGPLGAGNVAVGIVVGAFSLSAFFLRPWTGRLSDRHGRRCSRCRSGDTSWRRRSRSSWRCGS